MGKADFPVYYWRTFSLEKQFTNICFNRFWRDKKIVYQILSGGVQFVTQVPDVKPVFMVSGRAVLLKHYTIEKAIKSYETGCLYSVGEYASIDFNQEKTNISFLKGNFIVK